MTTATIISRLKARHPELSKAPAKAFRVMLARLAASKAAFKAGDLKGAKILSLYAARTLRMMLNDKLPKAIRWSGCTTYATAGNGEYHAFVYLNGSTYTDGVTVKSGRAFSRLIAA